MTAVAGSQPPEEVSCRRSARLRHSLLAVTAIVLVGGLVTLCHTGQWRRQWVSQGGCEQWEVVFDGYGEASCDEGLLRLVPTTATSADRTHAGLATSTTVEVSRGTVQTVRTTMTTVSQLRQGDDPNTWEVAWLLWSYTDNDHFYALVLKPNGWEVSKQDPAYPGKQRFLASGASPAFPPGTSHDVSVQIDTTRDEVTFVVTVDGRELGTVTDSETPYHSGAVAAYCEDAEVTFSPVTQEAM